MSTAIQALDERDARAHKLDNLRMVLRQAERDLEFKRGRIKVAEDELAELTSTAKALEKASKALADISGPTLARLRTSASREALLPARRLTGDQLTAIVSDLLADARARMAPLPELIESLRAEMPLAEGEVAALRQQVEDLAGTL